MTPNVSAPAPRPARAAIILAFAAVYIIWGSTYLGIRYAIETLPPFLMAGTRFMTAGAILFAWAMFSGARVESPGSQWRRAYVIGALLLLCGNGGVTWAEKYVPSSLAALLVATEPLWVVMLNWGFGGKRPNWKVSLGVLIGIVGVGLLVGAGLSNGGHVSTIMLVGAGVVILAGMAWAGGSVYASRNPAKGPTSLASGMQMLAGGSLLMLLSLVTGDFKLLNLSAASWVSLAAFGYLLVFGSLVGFTAYSWLLRNVTPASAATYAYVNPAVAVLLGWLLASEPLTWRMLVAATIIVCSVILITTFGSDHAPAAKDSLHDTECPTPPCA